MRPAARGAGAEREADARAARELSTAPPPAAESDSPERSNVFQFNPNMAQPLSRRFFLQRLFNSLRAETCRRLKPPIPLGGLKS